MTPPDRNPKNAPESAGSKIARREIASQASAGLEIGHDAAEAPARSLDPAGRLADFLFEAGALKRTPRTGYQFLGRGHENVAEHSFGTTMVAFVLGRLAEGDVDISKLMSMALFHDLAEARTGDLNYVNKRYVAADEDAAFKDATEGLPFEAELASLWAEWKRGETLEARLAKDADQLDMILELKRLSAHGWNQAADWLFYAAKRLSTEPGRMLADRIMTRGPDDWWFEKRDELWVNPKSPDPQALKRKPQDQKHLARDSLAKDSLGKEPLEINPGKDNAGQAASSNDSENTGAASPIQSPSPIKAPASAKVAAS